MELPEQEFNTWIRPLQVIEEGTVLRLLAPNRFVVDWLKQHYLTRMDDLVGDSHQLILEVGSIKGPDKADSKRNRFVLTFS